MKIKDISKLNRETGTTRNPQCQQKLSIPQLTFAFEFPAIAETTSPGERSFAEGKAGFIELITHPAPTEPPAPADPGADVAQSLLHYCTIALSAAPEPVQDSGGDLIDASLLPFSQEVRNEQWMDSLILTSPATAALDPLRARLDSLTGPELMAIRRAVGQAELKAVPVEDGKTGRLQIDELKIKDGAISFKVPFAFILSPAFLPAALAGLTPAIRATLDGKVLSLLGASAAKAKAKQEGVPLHADKSPVLDWVTGYVAALEFREQFRELKMALFPLLFIEEGAGSADGMRVSKCTATFANSEITLQLTPKDGKDSEFFAAVLTLLTKKQLNALDCRLAPLAQAAPPQPAAAKPTAKPATKPTTKAQSAEARPAATPETPAATRAPLSNRPL